jgi:hypothetical protein
MPSQFCGRTRREFLGTAGAGFSGLALSGLLARDGFGNTPAAGGNPMAPKKPMHPAKAKAVIFLFMYGGPSHVDTFDHKPKMYGMDGKTVQVKTFGRGGKKNQGRIVEPRWKFKPYGRCGKMVSDLFPNVGGCVDDLAFVHTMYAESPIHGSAMLMMNSGRLISGSPCLGSWVTYGLGSENENLPGFVVMLDKTGGPISGPKNWSSGFMPAAYQGVTIRATDTPIFDLQPPPGVTREQQRTLLDRLKEKNEEHLRSRQDNSELAARIASYELAFQMQQHAPEAVDFKRETKETLELYGIEGPTKERTADFGRKCLLARRLVERGVRFVQIYSGGAHNDDNWDAHTDMEKNHNKHAGNTDLPIAGLLKDLKRSGLLDSTIVVWGGEFGRQPTAEYATGSGRDHNSEAFTMWLAGGGVKGGQSIGVTDELGSAPVGARYHVKNLHATILNQMGLDPNRLSYFYGGLDQKLVGVEGAEPIHGLT